MSEVVKGTEGLNYGKMVDVVVLNHPDSNEIFRYLVRRGNKSLD